MFSRSLLLELVDHMEWADARVWSTVPNDGAPDQKLREWLVHLHMVQRAFLTVWTGGDVRTVFRTGDHFANVADVRAWARPVYAEIREVLAATDDRRLAGPLVLPWSRQLTRTLGREPAPSTMAETCFQVTSHSTYHRGQINARLRALGHEPPLVDYIAWLWLGRPTADWTL